MHPILSRIAPLDEAFLFHLCHIAGKVQETFCFSQRLSKGNFLGHASMQNIKINLLEKREKNYYVDTLWKISGKFPEENPVKALQVPRGKPCESSPSFFLVQSTVCNMYTNWYIPRPNSPSLTLLMLAEDFQRNWLPKASLVVSSEFHESEENLAPSEKNHWMNVEIWHQTDSGGKPALK